MVARSDEQISFGSCEPIYIGKDNKLYITDVDPVSAANLLVDPLEAEGDRVGVIIKIDSGHWLVIAYDCQDMDSTTFGVLASPVDL